ncbi:hypothetical protein EV13_0412 [Prochlorococcus sp. MIT 0702]|nr:hypothetical protein EV12_1614 [Prochlorococcus sp. MIT 0701]KGG30081.1 hypothetical protein EV13_0412 [Prochlorococcus sp. MIT 0702]KGG33263.1 hypothetical protein EV14_1734 [Prochlorococcus sp. MIT 0703]
MSSALSLCVTSDIQRLIQVNAVMTSAHQQHSRIQSSSH